MIRVLSFVVPDPPFPSGVTNFYRSVILVVRCVCNNRSLTHMTYSDLKPMLKKKLKKIKKWPYEFSPILLFKISFESQFRSIYSVSFEFIWISLGAFGYIWVHWVLFGFIWVSIGFIWVRLGKERTEQKVTEIGVHTCYPNYPMCVVALIVPLWHETNVVLKFLILILSPKNRTFGLDHLARLSNRKDTCLSLSLNNSFPSSQSSLGLAIIIILIILLLSLYAFYVLSCPRPLGPLLLLLLLLLLPVRDHSQTAAE